MPQSLAKIWLHTVFSTRDRRRVFLLDHMRDATCAYMTGILNSLECSVARINMTTDHVHILHQMSRTKTVADAVGTVKRRTTEWLMQQEWTHGNMDFHQFHWQSGYGVFSVSESMVPIVKKYIDNQMEHHKRMTFQDEYRTFLQKYKVDFNERYVWD
jgi:putative transposase